MACAGSVEFVVSVKLDAPAGAIKWNSRARQNMWDSAIEGLQVAKGYSRSIYEGDLWRYKTVWTRHVSILPIYRYRCHVDLLNLTFDAGHRASMVLCIPVCHYVLIQRELIHVAS
jgi:hypothetical protein